MGARSLEALQLLIIRAATFRAIMAENLLLAQVALSGLAQQFRRMVRQLSCIFYG
jgi:hypothetical protein